MVNELLTQKCIANTLTTSSSMFSGPRARFFCALFSHQSPSPPIHDAAARIAERVKKERQEAYYDRYGFDEDVPQ